MEPASVLGIESVAAMSRCRKKERERSMCLIFGGWDEKDAVVVSLSPLMSSFESPTTHRHRHRKSLLQYPGGKGGGGAFVRHQGHGQEGRTQPREGDSIPAVYVLCLTVRKRVLHKTQDLSKPEVFTGKFFGQTWHVPWAFDATR